MTSADRHDALQRLRSGDASAQGTLLESYRPYLGIIARNLGREAARAHLDESDLIQEALLEAHRSLASFRGQTVAELTGWVRQVAIRAFSRQLRKMGGAAGGEQELDGLPADDSSPSERAIRHEETLQVTAALARLPQEMQDVLLGRHLHGWSYAEIAQHLHKSEGALRVMYFRALKRLQNELLPAVR